MKNPKGGRRRKLVCKDTLLMVGKSSEIRRKLSPPKRPHLGVELQSNSRFRQEGGQRFHYEGRTFRCKFGAFFPQGEGT